MSQIQEDARTKAHSAVETWGDMVYRLALSRMHDHLDAEDVFQTVFLKYIRNTPTFENGVHEKAWLLRTTINCCNDLYRTAWKRQHVSYEGQDNTQEQTVTPAPENFDSKDDPFPLLSKAMEKLSEAQRTTLHLYYCEEYSSDEIAELLGENPSTVRSHLHRGRSALKTILGANHE